MSDMWNRVAFVAVVVALTVLIALGKLGPEALVLYVGGNLQPPVAKLGGPPSVPPAIGVLLVMFLVGCGASQTERSAATAATYGAELDECVATSNTLSVAQSCFCKVASKYQRDCPLIRPTQQ